MSDTTRGLFTLAEVAAFLDGTAPLDGVWFDESHPTESGAYWWRKHLRAALSAAEARERALVRRIIAAGDAIVERDDGEAYHQLYEALRDVGHDDLPSGTFDAARAALTEGERDG